MDACLLVMILELAGKTPGNMLTLEKYGVDNSLITKLTLFENRIPILRNKKQIQKTVCIKTTCFYCLRNLVQLLKKHKILFYSK